MSNRSDRPHLPTVTLVAVTSIAIRPTIEALRASAREVEFAQVLLLSDEPPPQTDLAITWRRIERLGSRLDYSRFMLRGLAQHISTSHALCIQWDGFVLNGAEWNPRFLEFDYIGSVWPHFRDDYNVGNGGFSLRSKRFLDACCELPLVGNEPEDVFVSRVQRPRLEELGMRFAPEAVARQFAYERTAPTGREFGFHGAFNLVRHLSNKDATNIFRSLEPALLARNERWELLRWALVRGRMHLAMTMLGRLI